MYLIKTPPIIQNLFPRYKWRVPQNVVQPTSKIIYLTFDDGPVPEVTPWVLSQLAQYNALATFFCVGDNVCKHTDIFRTVQAAGHTVGNHSFNHFNGWGTETADYIANVALATHVTGSTLFRPPYGKLRPSQAHILHRDYKIIMWDVLSGDFDPNISPEQCLQNVLRNTRRGSIIVFHDSLKASKNLFFTLPRILAHFSAKGYRFEALQPVEAEVPEVVEML